MKNRIAKPARTIKTTTKRLATKPLSSNYIKYKQWIAQGRPGGKFIP